MHDLTQFSLKDMTECGTALRGLGAEAASLEEAANRIVRYLYEDLGHGQDGDRACVLVRFFKTHPFNRLDSELQRFATTVLGHAPVVPTMPCFTLMATAGVEPAWNDRRQSQRFQAIPIADRQFVAQFPMFSQLLAQFGVEIDVILEPRTELLLDKQETTYNIFHVHEAAGSPYVPGQKQFVIPYGVRSVLGFGGLLPSGSLFTVILFAKVPIPRDTAELFGTLALNVKLALLPFDGRADFAQSQTGRHGGEAEAEGAVSALGWLKARASAQEQLLHAHERAVVTQAGHIKEATRQIREQAEALKETANRLQAIWDNAPAVMYVKDIAGRHVIVNHQFERLLRLSSAEIIGKTNHDLFPQDVADAFRTNDLRVLESKAPLQIEEIVHQEDGTHTYVSVKFPVLDAQGVPVGICGISTDITAHRRAEEALREHEVNLRLALQAAHMGTWSWNVQTRRMVWSGEVTGLFGSTPGAFPDTIDAYFFEYVHPDDRNAVVEAVKRAIEERVPYDIEHRLVIPDGQSRWMACKGEVYRDDEGKAIHMTGTVMDISERKRLEEQLFRAQKMEAIGRLAGGVAHDFNNLLTVITGYSEMLLHGLDADNPFHRYAEDILKAGERAATLTGQLLAFSRGQVTQPRVVDLNLEVSKMAGMLQRVIGEDVELVTRLGQALLPVKADGGQLDQVLMNLAVNARDAMSKGGTLTIETANVAAGSVNLPGGMPARPAVRLTVSDTGHGMDAATLSHIFEPFFTTKGQGKGTGLGLATVYGIVTQSGGTIGVDSHPGQGTKITIHLPSVDEPVAAAQAGTDKPRPTQGTETVLVVEDEISVRAFIRTVLARKGYQVLEASTGEEALALRAGKQAAIPLLVTDMVMPGMNGRELAEQVRLKWPGTGVLFISGYTEDADLRRGVQKTDTDFLAKPFTAEALVAAVRRVLDAVLPGPGPAG